MARPDDLEIEQDLAFQRREWRFQRIGFFVLVLFVVGALLGLFGSGPLSRAEARTGGLIVKYERLTRVYRDTRLTIEMPPATSYELGLDRNSFDRMRIERVHPEPAGIEIGANEVRFRFDPPGAGDGPLTAIFEITLRAPGLHRINLRAGNATASFNQFVFF